MRKSNKEQFQNRVKNRNAIMGGMHRTLVEHLGEVPKLTWDIHSERKERKKVVQCFPIELDKL